MSIQAIAWAWRQQPSSPTLKFVLVVLADHVNCDTGRCFPSLNRVAKITGLARSTVAKAMKLLEEEGYFERHRRVNSSGDNTSTSYVFHAVSYGFEGSPSGRPPSPPAGPEPVVNPAIPSKEGIALLSKDRFQKLWKRWPKLGRKRSKGTQEATRKLIAIKIKKHGDEMIQKGVNAYLDSDEPWKEDEQYACGLKAFFSQERYRAWAEA